MKKISILGAISGALVAGSLTLAGPALAHPGNAGDGSRTPAGQSSTSAHSADDGRIGVGIFTAPAAGADKPGSVNAAPAYTSDRSNTTPGSSDSGRVGSGGELPWGMISIGALIGSAHIAAYNMSKAADLSLVKSLAMEWGKHNIRVNAIAPGLVQTDFAKALWDNPEIRKANESKAALKRIGQPDDIGGVAVFLASKAGNFVCGQCIIADGGVIGAGAE